MKKQFLTVMFLLLLATVISAQFKETTKIAEFENPNCEDLKARLDNLYNVLKADSAAKAFIISYEGKHSFYDDKKNEYVLRLPKLGESSFINQTMMNYLFLNRDLPKDKVFFVNGGFREKYTVELWLVPRARKSPLLNPTLNRINYRKGKLRDLCGEY